MEGMEAMVLFCKKNNNWDRKVILPHVQHQPNPPRTRTKAPALWTSLSQWTLSWLLWPTVRGSKLEGTWETTSHRRSGWNRTVLSLLSTAGKTHSRSKKLSLFKLNLFQVCDRCRFLGQLVPCVLSGDRQDLADHIRSLWRCHLPCKVNITWTILAKMDKNKENNLLHRSECNNTSDCYIVSGSEDCTVRATFQ